MYRKKQQQQWMANAVYVTPEKTECVVIRSQPLYLLKVTQTKNPSKSGVILVSNKIRGQNQNIIYHSPK